MSTQPATEHRFAEISTAADRYVCHPKTIRRMIAAGEITGYRLRSRKVLVDLNELDASLTPIPSAVIGGRDG